MLNLLPRVIALGTNIAQSANIPSRKVREISLGIHKSIRCTRKEDGREIPTIPSRRPNNSKSSSRASLPVKKTQGLAQRQPPSSCQQVEVHAQTKRGSVSLSDSPGEDIRLKQRPSTAAHRSCPSPRSNVNGLVYSGGGGENSTDGHSKSKRRMMESAKSTTTAERELCLSEGFGALTFCGRASREHPDHTPGDHAVSEGVKKSLRGKKSLDDEGKQVWKSEGGKSSESTSSKHGDQGTSTKDLLDDEGKQVWKSEGGKSSESTSSKHGDQGTSTKDLLMKRCHPSGGKGLVDLDSTPFAGFAVESCGGVGSDDKASGKIRSTSSAFTKESSTSWGLEWQRPVDACGPDPQNKTLQNRSRWDTGAQSLNGTVAGVTWDGVHQVRTTTDVLKDS